MDNSIFTSSNQCKPAFSQNLCKALFLLFFLIHTSKKYIIQENICNYDIFERI